MVNSQVVDVEARFALEIDYTKGKGDPTRVFRSMVHLIETCEHIDTTLLSAVDMRLQPLITLDDLETYSLKSLLRTLVRYVPDDAVLHLDPKPLLGQFLLMGKKRVIDWTANRTTVNTLKELEPLVDELNSLTDQTQTARLPGFSLINPKSVLSSMAGISTSLAYLEEEDKAMYASEAGQSVFNNKFRLSPDDVEDLLTATSLLSEVEMILRVKRPDFMGESKWEFKHGPSALIATIEDKEWLHSFQDGEVVLRPQDTVRAMIRTILKYDSNNELIGTRHAVIKVMDIIPGIGSRQPLLPQSE